MHFLFRAALHVSLLTVPAWSVAEDAAPGPSLAVMPAVIDWVLKEDGRSGTAVRIANLSPHALRVSATLRDWHFSDDGAVVDTAAVVGGLAARVAVVPDRLDLEPGARRTLRLWLEDSAGLASGEHRALLVLEARDVDGVLRLRSDHALYAQLGPQRVAAHLESAQWQVCDGLVHVAFTVVNEGSGHARMEGWISAEGLPRAALPRTPVLPGERRVLRMTVAVGERVPERLSVEGVLGRQSLDGAVVQRVDALHCPPERL